jgi:exopolysaccharide production protein ExoZ
VVSFCLFDDMLKDDKIVSIQYLRGLAALGVVLCHYGSDIKSYPKLSRLFSSGQLGVHVFFLISGFIIVYSLIKSDYKTNQFFKFLLKRSIRIDPAYIVVIVLTILLFKILSYMPSFKGDRIPFLPGQFFAHIFYIVPFTKYSFYNHVFWTLSVEFQFYLLVGILYFLFDKPLYRTGFLILFGLTCFIPFSIGYYLVFNYAPIFALGISLVGFYRNRNWLNIILPILLLCLIAYKFGITIFILLTICSIAILSIKIFIRSLSFLGNISYSLYLIHGLVLIVFLGVVKRFHADLNQNQLLWLFIEVSIAIISGYLFYLLIERPSLRLSKWIFYKTPSEKQ